MTALAGLLQGGESTEVVAFLIGLLAPVAVGIAILVHPPIEGRLARVASDVDSDVRSSVAAYLRRTRRWRTAGLLCAFVVALGTTFLEPSGIGWLPFGWLAGAVIAEMAPGRVLIEGSGMPNASVPRWLLWTPLAIAVATMISSALVIAYGPGGSFDWHVGGWGLAALGSAAMVVIGNAFVTTRLGHVGGDVEVDRALRARSIGEITAGGVALAIVCLVHQLSQLRHGMLGEMPTAIEAIEWTWIFGAVMLGLLLAKTIRPALASTVVVILVVVSGLAVGWAWRKDRPPYAVTAVHPTATIRLTDAGGFAADEQALGVTDLQMPKVDTDERAFVGRVDFAVPANAADAGRYYVVVLDSRNSEVMPGLTNQYDDGIWDPLLDNVPKQLRWLKLSAASGLPRSDISVVSSGPAPAAFSGILPEADLSVSDLTVVVIFVGSDGQLYWATRALSLTS